MTEKRLVDRIRESAGSMLVGDASDGAIIGPVSIDGRLYIVKEKAIYLVTGADDIDPGRTNADIPNTQQLFLKHGSDSVIVCRIFLQPRELFRKDRLSPEIDWSAALRNSLEIIKDVIAAQETLVEYMALKAAAEPSDLQPQNRSFRMPAVPGPCADAHASR